MRPRPGNPYVKVPEVRVELPLPQVRQRVPAVDIIENGDGGEPLGDLEDRTLGDLVVDAHPVVAVGGNLERPRDLESERTLGRDRPGQVDPADRVVDVQGQV